MSSESLLDICFKAEEEKTTQDMHENTEESPAHNDVQFCTMDDDDDEPEAMVPQFDEFDMWEQQQSVAGGDAGRGKETISDFQKLFLEELGKNDDVNAAAAKALQRLASSSPTSMSVTISAPQVPVVEFLTMCDDDDDNAIDYELDEFDLWDHQQSSADEPRSEEDKETISSFQKVFLDELHREGDVNGAAAEALKKLFASRSAKAAPQIAKKLAMPCEISCTTPSGNGGHGNQQAAESLFRRLYTEELDKCGGDANLAAAKALRRLNQGTQTRQPSASANAPDVRRQQALRAIRSMLAKEAGTGQGDANRAVAEAILRIRKVQRASTQEERESEQHHHHHHASTSKVAMCDGGQVAVAVGASS